MTENTQISTFENENNSSGAGESISRFNTAVYFLLCFILVFTTIAYGAVDFWALGLLCIFSGLLVIFWCADIWRKKEFQFNTSLLQLPLLGLILIGSIQLLPLRSSNLGDLLSVPAIATLTLDASATRFAVVNLVLYFVFFAAAFVFINNDKRLRKTVYLIIIFGAVMAFFGILQRFANLEAIYGMRPTTQSISFGSFVNQHHFAAFMEMTIGVTLGLLFGKALKKDKNALLIIAVVIMGIALLLTGSRGGVVSLLGVFAFIVAVNLLFKQKKPVNPETETSSNLRRNLALIGGGIALICGLFLATLFLGGDQSLIRGTGLESGSQPDISNGRLHFWQIALKIFFDNPVIGAGLNSFGTAFPNYDTWNGTFRVEQAHNDYLQILADAGIIGFICIASFVVLLFKKGFQVIGNTTDNFRRNTAIGALAGCFGILLHSFVDFPLRTSSNAFFFLTLVVLATAAIHYPKITNRLPSR